MMSSRKYALPLHLEVQVSQRLRFIIIIAHAWCALLALVLAAEALIKIVLLIMVLASLVFYLNRFYLTKRCMPCSIVLKDEAQVRLQFADDNVEYAIIMGDTYLHPSLVILRLQTENGRALSLPMLRDSMSGDQHRQLRVYLRLQQYRMEVIRKKTPVINA